jgi:hypothetical protein
VEYQILVGYYVVVVVVNASTAVEYEVDNVVAAPAAVI